MDYINTEKYISRAVGQIFPQEQVEILFYGSFARKEMKAGSDIDILLLVKKVPSVKKLQKIKHLQKSFFDEHDVPLSFELCPVDSIASTYATGTSFLKILSIASLHPESLSLQNAILKLSDDKQRIVRALLEECTGIRRMFLFNLMNQWPSGRIFKNYDLKNHSSKELKSNLDKFVTNSFLSLVGHFIAHIKDHTAGSISLSQQKKLRNLYESINQSRVSSDEKIIALLSLLDYSERVIIKTLSHGLPNKI